MPQHDPLIESKLATKGWDSLRPTFQHIHQILIGTSPTVSSKAETVYIKYRIQEGVFADVFAVVWVRTTKQLITGLALPPGYQHSILGPPPPRTYYPPLNSYFTLTAGQPIPEPLAEWAQGAFKFVSQNRSSVTVDEDSA